MKILINHKQLPMLIAAYFITLSSLAQNNSSVINQDQLYAYNTLTKKLEIGCVFKTYLRDSVFIIRRRGRDKIYRKKCSTPDVQMDLNTKGKILKINQLKKNS